jgi:hypothetical protein
LPPARRTRQLNKLVDVAETIANSQLLLLLPTSSTTPPERPA